MCAVWCIYDFSHIEHILHAYCPPHQKKKICLLCCVFNNMHVCECVNYTQYQHVYTAGLASWLFWEPNPQWYQHPPTHQPSPWHCTKTFLAERGSIVFDTFILEVCAAFFCHALPLLHLLLYSSSVCTAVRSVYYIIKELHCLAWPALSACFSLSLFCCSYPLSLSESFFLTLLF